MFIEGNEALTDFDWTLYRLGIVQESYTFTFAQIKYLIQKYGK